MVILTCPACLIQFSRPKAHVRGKTNCCSKLCSEKIKGRKAKNTVTYNCKLCGSERTVRRGAGGKLLYCSKACRAKAVGIFRTGKTTSKRKRPKDDHPERTALDSKFSKQIISERKSCEKCGSKNSLHAHHIKPYSAFPELRLTPSNIMVLCRNCHANEHPEIKNFILNVNEKSSHKIECVECGSERFIKKSEIGKAKYCSKKCQLISLHKKLKRSNSSCSFIYKS